MNKCDLGWNYDDLSTFYADLVILKKLCQLHALTNLTLTNTIFTEF